MWILVPLLRRHVTWPNLSKHVLWFLTWHFSFAFPHDCFEDNACKVYTDNVWKVPSFQLKVGGILINWFKPEVTQEVGLGLELQPLDSPGPWFSPAHVPYMGWGRCYHREMGLDFSLETTVPILCVDSSGCHLCEI